MPRELLDAVKAASNIHKGDFSSLRGKSFLICDNIKKKRRSDTMNKPKEEKMTLTKLAKIVNDGFSELRQDVRDINARLDYIVKANNLKDGK
ncbi:MAG: hypothetical protein MJ207_03315 [Bacilli bacterium]|nr:hypothetical protein [Bacilli bacterium]